MHTHTEDSVYIYIYAVCVCIYIHTFTHDKSHTNFDVNISTQRHHKHCCSTANIFPLMKPGCVKATILKTMKMSLETIC